MANVAIELIRGLDATLRIHGWCGEVSRSRELYAHYPRVRSLSGRTVWRHLRDVMRSCAPSNAISGLRFGLVAPLQSLGVLGALLQHAPCLRVALDQIHKHRRLAIPARPIVLHESQSTASVRIVAGPRTSPLERFLSEAQLGFIINVARSFDSGWAPRAIRLRSDMGSTSGGSLPGFSCSVNTNSPCDEVEFDRATLDIESPWFDEAVWEELLELANERSATLNVGTSSAFYTPWCSRALSVLWSARDFNYLTNADVARRLGVSSRHLRRSLAREGVCLSDLLAQVRLELALHALEDHTRSLKSIALALRFSQVSAFHRAFKRLTGFTPTKYRQLCHARSAEERTLRRSILVQSTLHYAQHSRKQSDSTARPHAPALPPLRMSEYVHIEPTRGAK